jgi:hypothetical protein
MNAFDSVEALGDINAEFLSVLKEETLNSRKEARGPPKSSKGRASREPVRYIPYGKVGTNNINHINNELRSLYRGVSDGIADGIAIVNDKKVFIIDSGKENGKIDFGVRKIIKISNDVVRNDYVRRTNSEAISKGYVSDGLSSKLGDRHDNDRGRDLRRELGTELSTDQGKSADNQSGVFGEDADKRGLNGKASQDLDFFDFLEESEGVTDVAEVEARELSNREMLADMLERDDMSPSQKGFLTKYKNKIAQIEANERKIADMTAELDALKKSGKGKSAKAATLENQMRTLEKQNAALESIILNLEATKPIKRLLERERKANYESI